MTVLKGFTTPPDPLDMESFRRLTDPEARKRFRDKFEAFGEVDKARTMKVLADVVKLATPETEAVMDKSEAFSRKDGWASWESDIPHDGPCAIFATCGVPEEKS
jgi:hypothetical protein